MFDELMRLEWEQFLALIGAVAALGTAAMGLVDGTKAAWGGINCAGFGHVVDGLRPFNAALGQAVPDWKSLFRAHWLNGTGKAEQKALAAALIKLGLTTSSAADVAKATRVDPDALQAFATKLATGAEPTAAELNLFGRSVASLEAQLDAAFERADHQFRNVARMVSGAVAIALAVVASAILGGVGSFSLAEGARAMLLGVIAVPLAPIAKDLISGLSAAARAVKAGRR